MEKNTVENAIEQAIIAALENPPESAEDLEMLDRAIVLARRYISKK